MALKTSGNIIWSVLIVAVSLGCSKPVSTESRVIETDHITENVIVVVIDGPRFSETWGDPEHSLIPQLSTKLASRGIINQQFYNRGTTHTIPGHTTIATGIHDDISNNGKQYPAYPSYLQHWLSLGGHNPNQAWIVGSKQKLEVLGNCSNIEWRNSYLPSVDVADRSDMATFIRVKEIIAEHHPRMLLINLKEPDFWGHKDEWDLYKKAITETDSMLSELCTLVESDSIYAGKTTIIMTNDHGRHLDGIQNGFVNHGDHCIGCTHINFFAIGPDFKADVVTSQRRDQRDIAPTVARLMGFEMKQGQGEVMIELFKP